MTALMPTPGVRLADHSYEHIATDGAITRYPRLSRLLDLIDMIEQPGKGAALKSWEDQITLRGLASLSARGEWNPEFETSLDPARREGGVWDAADRGLRIHRLVEIMLNGINPIGDPPNPREVAEAGWAIRALADHFGRDVLTPQRLVVEQPVIITPLGVGGTPDLLVLGDSGGVQAVIDWKTGKTDGGRRTRRQLTAYATGHEVDPSDCQLLVGHTTTRKLYRVEPLWTGMDEAAALIRSLTH